MYVKVEKYMYGYMYMSIQMEYTCTKYMPYNI